MVAAVWRRISSGTDNDLILASDFSTTGRRDAGFSGFVPMLDPARTVWETAPPQAGADWETPGGDHVDAWVAALPEDAGEVSAVLGYCASSVYAAALVERIAARQENPPRLVLFDPVGVTGDSLYGQFEVLTRSLGVALEDDEVAAALLAGQDAWRAASDLTRLASALVATFEKAGRVAFERLELTEDVSRELTDGFAAYLSYLVAADGIEYEPAWRSAVAITSATPGPGAQLTRDSIGFDIPHTDLLRSPAVAAAVSRVIAEPDPARR